MASRSSARRTASVQSPKKTTAQLPKLESGSIPAATSAMLLDNALELMGSEIGRTHRVLQGYKDTVDMIRRSTQRIEESFIETRKRWAEPFIQAIRHTDEYVWPDNADSDKQNHIWMMIGTALREDREAWGILMRSVEGDAAIEGDAELKDRHDRAVADLIGFGMIAGIMFSSMTRIKITPPALPAGAEKVVAHV